MCLFMMSIIKIFLQTNSVKDFRESPLCLPSHVHFHSLEHEKEKEQEKGGNVGLGIK